MSRLDPAFLSMMPDDVVVHFKSGQDRYGKTTFSGTTTVKGRIETKAHKTVDSDGETVFVRGKVYTSEVTGITPEDDLQLPGGERPRIISVTTERDEHGPLYEVISYA